MTESPEDARAADTLRLLLRRAGHELRNAQNATAVNLEALRSRGSENPALKAFADNAAEGLEESILLAEGAISLCGALLAALLSGGGYRLARGSDGSQGVELTMDQEAAARLITATRHIGGRLGLAAEPTGAGVILSVRDDPESSR